VICYSAAISSTNLKTSVRSGGDRISTSCFRYCTPSSLKFGTALGGLQAEVGY